MTSEHPVVIASHEMAATPMPAELAALDEGKLKVAMISLCGCWGCTLSMLDMDERILPLLEKVTINRSSLTDIKRITGRCDIGFIEGGVANEENIETLQHFREHCDILISVGACAIWGGVPALRNVAGLSACLEEAYVNSPTMVEGALPVIPQHEDIPRLTAQVYPCHEVVQMDYFIPGCPPDGDAVFAVLDDLVNGRPVSAATSVTRYD
jgi:NAD-reducing hydrogenase small subunit